MYLDCSVTYVPGPYPYAYNTTDYIVGRTGQVMRSEPGGPALVETQYRYDGAATWQTAPLKGDLTEVSRYLAEESRYVTGSTGYDSFANPTSVTDETGRTVTTEYDTTHTLFPVRTTNAATESVDLVWDAVCGAVLETTDANHQTTTTDYDALCRPERTDLPLGGWMERFYLDLGNPTLQRTRVETAGAPGAGGTDWTENSFDGLGQSYKTERRGPPGQGDILAERTYNARGAVKTSTEPYYWGETPRETAYEYDEFDRAVLVVLPGGLTAETTYEPGSQEQIDPKGTVVITQLDAYGRTVEVERSLGGQPVITESTYDPLGRLVGMEDAVANEWTWVFDSLGRLTDEDDPDAGQWSYIYDDAGRLSTQTDAKAQVTTLLYDTAGRLQTKTNTGGTVTYAYGQPRASYLNVGRLTTVTSPADVLEMDYDALGRPVHQKRTLDGQGYEVQRAYDGLSGALSTITYPDNDSVGPMAYDEAGRVSAIPGIVTALTYDGAGRPLSQTNTNTTQTLWTYTADRGLLQAIDTTGSQGTIQDLDYVYDDAGLAQSVTSAVAGEGWNYTYDDLYRMDTSTNHSSSADDQSFAYDSAGRITSNSRVGTYTYPTAGQPRPHAPDTVAGNALTYDANGNLLNGGGRSYVWDADNLVSQITMGAATTSFAYDGFGSRVKKTTGASTSLYPFGDDYEITSGVVTKYIAVEGLGVIAKRVGYGPSAATHWLHNDRLGSIQAVTDATGAVDYRRSYRPYGETLGEAGSPTESRGWIDQRNDPETGLTYLHARYYDPQLGVFLSPDPIGVAGGMNAYGYAFGDPVNLADRSGYGPDDVGGFCGGIFGILCDIVVDRVIDWLTENRGGGRTIHECHPLLNPCNNDNNSAVPRDPAPTPPEQTEPPPAPIVVVISEPGRVGGGGDGGDDGRPPQLPNGTPHRFWAPFLEGFEDSQRRLLDERCGSFYGDEGPTRMNETTYRFVSPPSGTPAAGIITPTHVMINPRGAFMKPPARGRVLLPNGERRTLGTGRAFRGFILLHELGHQLSEHTGFVPDSPNAGEGWEQINARQSLEVIGACY